jgi:membrane fusion protein (multidrug efflux system)
VANYRIANDWVVDSGLHAGDRVVIEGIGKLRAGIPVKPVAVASVNEANKNAPPVASTK